MSVELPDPTQIAGKRGTYLARQWEKIPPTSAQSIRITGPYTLRRRSMQHPPILAIVTQDGSGTAPIS